MVGTSFAFFHLSGGFSVKSRMCSPAGGAVFPRRRTRTHLQGRVFSSLSAVGGRLHTSHIISTLFLSHLPMSQAPFETQKFIFAAFWAWIYLRWLCQSGIKRDIFQCWFPGWWKKKNFHSHLPTSKWWWFLVLQTFSYFWRMFKIKYQASRLKWVPVRNLGLKRQLIKEAFFEFPSLKGPFQLSLLPAAMLAGSPFCLFCY